MYEEIIPLIQKRVAYISTRFWNNEIISSYVLQIFDPIANRRQTCEGYFANSLRPISYLGFIWDLYVLSLKTKVFCRKNNQILKTMDKGFTVPRWVLQFGRIYPKCPQNLRPNLSAQAQKFGIFEKKLSLGFHSPCHCAY